MSEEPLDTRMEALFRAAQGRADVYRFQQVLREVASEVEARNDDKESRVIPIDRGRWKWWAAAASVAVLIGIGAMTVWLNGGGHNAEKYQEFAYIDIPLSMERGTLVRDVVDSVHAQLSATFNTRVQERELDPGLISLLEDALTDSVYRSRYRTPAGVMLARVYLSSGMPEEAKKALENSGAEINQPCAYRYYLAVACFANGNDTSAKTLMAMSGCEETRAAFDLLEQAQ